MADSVKAKSPGSEVKKAQEGSGKKRRKHKKTAETSGDGAPSAAPVSLSTKKSPAGASESPSIASQSPAGAGQQQSQPEGATAAIGVDNKQEINLPGNHVAKGEEGLKVREPAGKVSAKKLAKNEEKEILSHGDISGDGETHEKHLSNKETKANKQQKPKSPKQDSEANKTSTSVTDGSKQRKDASRTETPKHTELGGKNSETPEVKIQAQAGKEKKSNETSKCEGTQQKNIQEQLQNSRAEGDHGQKPKTQTKEVVKGNGTVDSEHKLKSKVEVKPGEADGEQKSKAQMRAERRAVQEAQRAAKDAKKGDTSVAVTNPANAVTGRKETAVDKSKPAADKSKLAGDKSKPAGDKLKLAGDKSKPAGDITGGEKNSKKKSEGKVAVQAETEEQMWTKKEREILGISLKIDNSILNLGFQYFHHNIVGANARCMALLATLKEVITKYRTPDGKELSRDLEKNFLNPCIKYINYCRPLSTSMGNAIKHLKHHINKIPNDMDDDTAISKLRDEIDNFIQVNIIKAAEAVALYANTKIDNGDVILIYAASSLIGQVLKTAYKGGKRFRVIVVEGRPRSEGKSMLRYLVRCGIPCSYIYIGSASHAMNEATKVFLGAAAMFAIGDMYSRSGNSMIAALAKANNIPVLVCCETYKFTDKVQLHTGDSNLHTRGKDLVSIGHKTPILTNWEDIGLGLLNLMYDVTGSEYITAVVTEFGMLPCTSVPVVLRRQEDLS